MTNTTRQPCDEGVIKAISADTPCDRKTGQWVLIATILGSSLAFIDGTVVNVALPSLQSALNATVIDVQWVVESYALFLAALLLVGGSLGDLYGRRRVYALGVMIFAIASLVCGLVPNVRYLILARGVQGVGAALLIPGSLAIISASFSEQERGRAIGTWSGFTSITAAIGPVLGGWLIERLSWRWVFFINIPLALLVLLITFWRLPESHIQEEGKRLDWPGAGLATLGLAGIVYALIESSNQGWKVANVITAALLGVFAFVVFFIIEARTPTPMLPLELFGSRNFRGANLMTLFLYSALSGALFFFPLNLIQVQGYSTPAAGAALLPFILLIFLLSRWSGGLVERYGAKLPLVIGPLVAALGFSLFIWPSVGGNYWKTFFPAVIVLGLGMAISVAPLTTTVMNAVPDSHTGIASGINNAVSRVAAVLAIAFLGIVMVNTFNRSLDDHLSALRLEPEVRAQLDGQRLKLAALEIPESLPTETKANLQQAIKYSFVFAFRRVMGIAAGLAILSSASAYWLIESRHQVEKS